jgi:hypothetical protein
VASRIYVFISAVLLPVAALAHGEAVLVPIFGQAIVVVATLLSLRLVPTLRPFWLAGAFGCIAGAALAWLALSSLPFLENRGFIMFWMAAAPAVLSALLVFLAKRRASK